MKITVVAVVIDVGLVAVVVAIVISVVTGKISPIASVLVRALAGFSMEVTAVVVGEVDVSVTLGVGGCTGSSFMPRMSTTTMHVVRVIFIQSPWVNGIVSPDLYREQTVFR
jgi:hypothetical protein